MSLNYVKQDVSKTLCKGWLYYDYEIQVLLIVDCHKITCSCFYFLCHLAGRELSHWQSWCCCIFWFLYICNHSKWWLIDCWCLAPLQNIWLYNCSQSFTDRGTSPSHLILKNKTPFNCVWTHNPRDHRLVILQINLATEVTTLVDLWFLV